MDHKAAAAVAAAHFRSQWGRAITKDFLCRNGVPIRLYQLAVALKGENHGA